MTYATVLRRFINAMTLCEAKAVTMDPSRHDRATSLGYTVDAYHGTSRDFASFRHIKKAHFGFHFGSTPAAAEQKLKADRDKDNPAVNRGSDAEQIFSSDDRDAVLQGLRQKHAELAKVLHALNVEVADRVQRSPADDALLAAALANDDDDEIHRLLDKGQPRPTAQEAARIQYLRDRIDDIERRMSLYFSQARPGERIIPVKLRLRNPIRMRDTNWGDPARIAGDNRELKLPNTSLAAIRQALERRGYDGIVYRNEVEDIGADSYIVFSPNQIRSRFANFHPSKARSSHISA